MSQIILPAADLRGITNRRGEQYVSMDSLIAYLYKCAAEPGQSAEAQQAYRMLAESFEEGR